MSSALEVILVAAPMLLLCAAWERWRLRRFWKRPCTGALWRRNFPTAPKAQIRTFLDLVLHAFAFSPSRRLRLAPHDRILDLYHAFYPCPKLVGDAMELETFAMSVEEHFLVNVESVWREDITLGELFAFATAPSRPRDENSSCG